MTRSPVYLRLVSIKATFDYYFTPELVQEVYTLYLNTAYQESQVPVQKMRRFMRRYVLVLFMLSETGYLSLRALREYLNIDPSVLGKVFKPLVERGFVEIRTSHIRSREKASLKLREHLRFHATF